MQSIIDLAIKHSPIRDSNGLIFYYMTGGLRFDLNNDIEVQFLWKNIPSSLTLHKNGRIGLENRGGFVTVINRDKAL